MAPMELSVIQSGDNKFLPLGAIWPKAKPLDSDNHMCICEIIAFIIKILTYNYIHNMYMRTTHFFKNDILMLNIVIFSAGILVMITPYLLSIYPGLS
jgi:hypothetical protein